MPTPRLPLTGAQNQIDQVTMDKAQTGRHRRTRFDWWRWRPQLGELGAVVEVTVAELVAELQRLRDRERAYASRARRVLVVPRQRSTNDVNR
jgi:hypothetical protein